MNATDTALYSTLSGGTALVGALGGTHIYQTQAPRDAALPYLIFNMQSGMEENETPVRSDRMIYLVKCVAATMLQAGTIAVLADALLHNRTLTVTGYNNFWTARESHVHYLERDAVGHTIAHAGGEYAIRVEASR